MNTLKKACSVAAIFLLACCEQVYAEPNALTGTIGVGAMVIDSGNNLNPNGSEKILDSLDAGADRETTVIPLILPRLTWDVGAEKGVKLYLTTDPPIDEVGGFAFNLGGTSAIDGAGILDGALFFTPFDEAWENPYLTGVERVETDTIKYGLRVGLNRIMGTGLRVHMVYMNDDVKDDVIGSREPDLARDGAIYSLHVNYSYYPTEGLELRPRFSIRKGDYDGEANSFTKYKVELEARSRIGRLMVAPRIHYSYSDYDKIHPIFNTTRDNNGYGFSLMANYMSPFNLKDWSAMMLISLSKGDSNIDFYDTEALSIGCFFNYHL